MTEAEVSVHDEITEIERRLRVAQLHYDPQALEELLDDRMLLLSDGRPYFAKAQMLAACQATEGRVISLEWRNVQIIEFGKAAIVICHGDYHTAQFDLSLQFMRIWLKKSGQWKLIAGTIAQPTMP